jgi:hypothetical protein
MALLTHFLRWVKFPSENGEGGSLSLWGTCRGDKESCEMRLQLAQNASVPLQLPPCRLAQGEASGHDRVPLAPLCVE